MAAPSCCPAVGSRIVPQGAADALAVAVVPRAAEVYAARLDADKKPVMGADGFFVADKLLFCTADGAGSGLGQAAEIVDPASAFLPVRAMGCLLALDAFAHKSEHVRGAALLWAAADTGNQTSAGRLSSANRAGGSRGGRGMNLRRPAACAHYDHERVASGPIAVAGRRS